MEFQIRKIPFDPHRWGIYDPPDCIHAQGCPEAFALLDRLPERGLAVVGTRRPQLRSEGLVRKLIAELSESSLVILSGLAVGIDSFAHEAALDAGLPTIGILGCGIGLQYPPENEDLRRRILRSGGLILSEYESDQAARPHHFLNRNRLIAGLARATWIVQAPARSGALNTAKWARDGHRDLYATPGFPGDPSLAGNQRLIDADAATPVWGPHSLGKTWLELSSAGNQGTPDKEPAADEDSVVEYIRCHTARSGGITSSDLLDWAMSQGMTALECFERLQKAQQCGLVSERNGVLARSPITI